jgi:hypothetical protein
MKVLNVCLDKLQLLLKMLLPKIQLLKLQM